MFKLKLIVIQSILNSKRFHKMLLFSTEVQFEFSFSLITLIPSNISHFKNKPVK